MAKDIQIGQPLSTTDWDMVLGCEPFKARYAEEQVRPFHDSPLKLKPANPETPDRVTSALTKLGIQTDSVKIFTLGEVYTGRDIYALDTADRGLHAQYDPVKNRDNELRKRLGIERTKSWGTAAGTFLIKQDDVLDRISTALGRSFNTGRPTLRSSIEKALQNGSEDKQFGQLLNHMYSSRLYFNLTRALYFQIAYAVIESDRGFDVGDSQDSKSFAEIAQIFRDGHFILGVGDTKDGKSSIKEALVLAGNPAPEKPSKDSN